MNRNQVTIRTMMIIIMGDLTKLSSVNPITKMLIFPKLLKDLKELAEYDQFTSTNRPIFLNDNEDHPVRNRESPENSAEENVVSKTNQEPPQNSNMHQLIDECCKKVPEQQNALDSKLLSINSINSQRLDKKEQEVKIVEEQPAERRNQETRSGNTAHANYSLPEYDLFCFEIEPDQERLINLVENDNSDNSSNDPLLEEELLIDDSILSHESSDANFEKNPSISRPPPEPPDDNFDLEPEVISALMEDIDEPDEHFNPGREVFVSTKIEDDDYFPFMFVIRFFLPYFIFPEISPLLLSAESEDTIFDPGISD
nr:hypothetical protein [Tanacetum cinerariifolium]